MQIRNHWAGLILAGVLLVPTGAQAGQPPELPFSDIGGHWAEQDIIRGLEAGYFSRSGAAGRFEPERSMTRGEFVVLLDRMLMTAEADLYPLSLLSEHDEWEWGEGFEEPYLPYKDVDRLTWLYSPVLRLSVMLERMYGPGAIQTLFPGERFHHGAPIGREEAARLLAVCLAHGGNEDAAEWVREQGWLTGSLTTALKRGEAAVMADRVRQYLEQHPLLPLWNADGTRFPAVPEISELFPLFADFGDHPSAEERVYMEAAEAIMHGHDEADTYRQLKELAGTDFPNQLGVHYFLSWNPDATSEENMREAFRALDAYFAENRRDPGVLRLLCANIYDLSLQLEEDGENPFSRTRSRLQSYEQRVTRGSEEWEALSLYLAALDVKSGRIDQAIERYRALTGTREGLLNAVYYLVTQDRREEAEGLLANSPSPSDGAWSEAYRRALRQELARLDRQDEFRGVLKKALERVDQADGYRISGEAVLGPYTLKYEQDVDNKRQASRITGIYRTPEKLVLERLEMFIDGKQGMTYTRQFEPDRWTAERLDGDAYLHEWVEATPLDTRADVMQARYHVQSLGPYDVVTEWIPGETLTEQARTRGFEAGSVSSVPLYVNKYYVDRKSGFVARRMWRYEVLYDSEVYLVYGGTESYRHDDQVQVEIPDGVRKGADDQP